MPSLSPLRFLFLELLFFINIRLVYTSLVRPQPGNIPLSTARARRGAHACTPVQVAAGAEALFGGGGGQTVVLELENGLTAYGMCWAEAALLPNDTGAFYHADVHLGDDAPRAADENVDVLQYP